MKKTILPALLLLAISTLACQPVSDSPASPAPCPTPPPGLATRRAAPTARVSPPAAEPSLAPQTPTPRVFPPAYSRTFLDSLLAAEFSCHPQKTAEDIGIYIYDLTNRRELVSINADVPFQFASAFKAPALVYFLSSCRQIWDPSDAGWQERFRDLEAAQNVSYFTGPEYEAALSEFLAAPKNWRKTNEFFSQHRDPANEAGGEIDTRYFVLEKAYGMVAQSGNLAAADVLQFVFENCLADSRIKIEEACGGANAITSFNAWFYEFAGIETGSAFPRRGLYEYDSVLVNGVETRLATFGQRDLCAVQTATLKCDPYSIAYNVFTARDFFDFYNALYNLNDGRLRETAFSILQADEPGPARGNLKNLARHIHATSLSKNGHAFYNNGSINTDAGILRYKGRDYAVVTLSFNALDSMIKLYGSYDETGNPAGGQPGLIQNLLAEILTAP